MYSTKLVDGDEMMDRDDDGETSYKYNTFVDDDDDVAFEPTYLQALPTAAGRNVATLVPVYQQWSVVTFCSVRAFRSVPVPSVGAFCFPNLFQ